MGDSRMELVVHTGNPMDRDISLFGGGTRVSVRIGNDREETIEVSRDIWFDRDIDGRWLVWVQDHDTVVDGTTDGPTGAFVVRNCDVISFIEQLGKLIVDPSAYEDEPVFVGADGEQGRIAP
jgi:hypothetical protein